MVKNWSDAAIIVELLKQKRWFRDCSAMLFTVHVLTKSHIQTFSTWARVSEAKRKVSLSEMAFLRILAVAYMR